MNKEKIYFLLGIVAIQTGAFAIHWGLGMMMAGAGMLVNSYIEHLENKDDEEDEK